MSRTGKFDGQAGKNYYVKPFATTLPWGDDAIEGVPDANDGRVFTFPGLAADVSYRVIERAGSVPAVSDTAVASIDVGQVDLVDAPNATAVTAIANATEAAMVNDGDATALLTAIADKIAGDLTAGDLTALAIVSAIKADATLAQMIARIDADVTSRSSLDETSVRNSVGLASANLDAQLDAKPSYGDTSDKTKVSASANVLRETTTKVTS